jgi:hypothetical protein
MGMTNSAFPASWLPAAIVRAAVVTPPTAQWVPTSARHSAPELETTQSTIDVDHDGRGRHAEPEWNREMFDALRDEDPFDWLGFAAAGSAQRAPRTSAMTGTRAAKACPRWLRASFSSGGSSADVTSSPSGTNTGS